MGVTHGSDYGLPTLDLNFARNKSLIDTTTGRNLITFTRSQSNYRSTYVGSDGLIKYAAADEPRFDHDPTTGVCNGLLIEESRTNLRTYSTAPNASNNYRIYGNITQNATVAPDGTFTAAMISGNGGSNQGFDNYSNDYGSSSGQTQIYSVFVKNINATNVLVRDSVNSAFYTFTFSTETGSGTGGFQKLSNGWYRVWLSSTKTNQFGYQAVVIDSGNFTTNSFYVWGVQLENATFPTSYIPTTTSTLTRTADNATITGTNFSSWYNQSEGTMFASIRTRTPANTSNDMIFQFTDGTVFNRIELQQVGSGDSFPRLGGFFRYLNTTTADYLNQETGWNPDGNTVDNIAFGWNSSGYILQSRYDATPYTGTANYPQNLTQVSFRHTGTMSRLTYYPKRLPNNQLQYLTR